MKYRKEIADMIDKSYLAFYDKEEQGREKAVCKRMISQINREITSLDKKLFKLYHYYNKKVFYSSGNISDKVVCISDKIYKTLGLKAKLKKERDTLERVLRNFSVNEEILLLGRADEDHVYSF